MTDHHLQPECELPSIDSFDRYRSEEGEWADGVRPPHIIETIEDVAWAVGNLGPRPQLACGFCGERYRHESKTPDRALAWFRAHVCIAEGVPIDQWLAA